MPLTNAQTGGVSLPFQYGGTSGYNRTKILERVPISANQNLAQLTQPLPPRCRILWCELYNVAGLAYTGNDGVYTANQVGLAAFTATLATGTTTGSTMLIHVSGTNTSAFTTPVCGQPLQTSQFVNTNSVSSYLYVFPTITLTATGTGNFLNSSAATNTGGYRFVGTTTSTNTYAIIVQLEIETYADAAP